MRIEVPADIDSPDLPAAIAACTDTELNALGFGVIRVDATGIVTFYSDVERRLSGWRKEAVSRNFFTEMAPCLNTPAFRGRIERAIAGGSLDIAFDDVMDLPSGARDVERRVRVVSAPGGGYWILLQTYT